MKNMKDLLKKGKKFETGVILSGGGARGFAHAGILKALNEFDIFPDVISGVSAGAIVGALYADGHTPDQIYEIFAGQDRFFRFVRVIFPRKGLFKTVGLKKNLSKHLRASTFAELKIPLYVAATNIHTAKIQYFNQGEILEKVLASAAIPVLFEPIEINGNLYVDGGVIDNFPIAPIKKDCQQLIGISLNPIHPQNDFKHLFNIAERTFHLSVSSNLKSKIQRCDRVFEPEELGEFGLLDASKGKEMFELGYKFAVQRLKD